MRRPALRVLTMSQLLDAEREAEALAPDCGADAALCACVLSQALRQPDGHPVYRTGRAVLDALSPDELAELAERYLAERREAADLEGAMARLARSPADRLRWHILRAFHVLPTEARAQALTPEVLRDCAANLLLDWAWGCAAAESGQNPAFDEAVFRERRADG